MPSINPIKPIIIKAVKPNSFVKKALAYYSTGDGIRARAKTGKTSLKDPILRVLNMSTGNLPLGKFVKLIYSRNSKVVRGSENMLAVKLNTGEKGWLDTRYGTFVSEQNLRAVLYSIDSTFVAGLTDTNLLAEYDSLSPADKVKLAEGLEFFDWDEFWAEIGSDDESILDIDRSTQAYMDLVELIGSILGWEIK